ncbi:MAG: hypothetical protein WC850_04430 [Candidatus Gracilibacteria bacterium]
MLIYGIALTYYGYYLLYQPKTIIIQREYLKDEEYTLRFFNMDYYFLQKGTGSVIIINSTDIKSIKFK